MMRTSTPLSSRTSGGISPYPPLVSLVAKRCDLPADWRVSHLVSVALE